MLKLSFSLVLCLLTFICQAQSPQSIADTLKQSGPVNDFAELLTASEEAKLAQQIDSIEAATGVEYAMCLINKLQGTNIKDLAVSIGNSWGVGKADEDNGVLILLSRQPREVFVATGKGIEAQIPDADVQYIVDEYIVPYLRKDQYFDGFTKGITEMQNVLNGTSVIERKDYTLASIAGIMVILIVAVIIVYDYRKLGGFDPKMKKLQRKRNTLGGGYMGDHGSSGGSSGGGSFGGGGGGSSY